MKKGQALFHGYSKVGSEKVPDPPPFRQVSIVGLGLIGGSLGLCLRKGRLARKVIGFSRHEATVRRAKARGAIDDGDTELCPDWLGHSDLVVIATPPSTVVSIAQKIAKITSGPLILTDVSSTKQQIVRSLEKSLPSRIRFVGSHPMAGSEQSGIEAADSKLFKGATCVITRTTRTSKDAIRVVSELWKSVGGRPSLLTPLLHDALVAQISHLPHLAAVALTVSPEQRAMQLAAGGFADTTRIVSGDPVLWEDICRTNSTDIKQALDRLIAELSVIKTLIRRREFKSLRKRFDRARRRRQQLLQRN